MSPRDATATRGVILAAAADLLETGGPEAVTLRSVGAAAGLSRSAAYRHFEDKGDLLRALAAQTLVRLADGVRRAGAGAGAKAGAGSPLHRGCLAYLEEAVARPHHYLLIFGDAPVEAPGADLESAADDGLLALRELVEQAQAAGELAEAPPRELATVLWVLLHGLAQLRITGHLHEPRTVDGASGSAELVTLTLQALRPRTA